MILNVLKETNGKLRECRGNDGWHGFWRINTADQLLSRCCFKVLSFSAAVRHICSCCWWILCKCTDSCVTALIHRWGRCRIPRTLHHRCLFTIKRSAFSLHHFSEPQRQLLGVVDRIDWTRLINRQVTVTGVCNSVRARVCVCVVHGTSVCDTLPLIPPRRKIVRLFLIQNGLGFGRQVNALRRHVEPAGERCEALPPPGEDDACCDRQMTVCQPLLLHSPELIPSTPPFWGEPWQFVLTSLRMIIIIRGFEEALLIITEMYQFLCVWDE